MDMGHPTNPPSLTLVILGGPNPLPEYGDGDGDWCPRRGSRSITSAGSTRGTCNQGLRKGPGRRLIPWLTVRCAGAVAVAFAVAFAACRPTASCRG